MQKSGQADIHYVYFFLPLKGGKKNYSGESDIYLEKRKLSLNLSQKKHRLLLLLPFSTLPYAPQQ